ncbi:MAG: chloride channel protein, partial [Desulfuromonadales bacterium]|nr:chloride channel protein [Desulfuromonadales bacterium]NIS41334.1 chloride channel protein [Desulfuromonadales bacterium]
AAFFIDIHFKIKDVFAAIKLPRLAKPVVGGLLVGLIGLFFPQVFGNGYEFMQTVLLGEGV